MDGLDPTTRLSAAMVAAARLATERVATAKEQEAGRAAAGERLDAEGAAAGLGEAAPTGESAESASAG
jgi:predicted homoserine dehydrogenase-like protein